MLGRAGDHPRSRGVYDRITAGVWATLGSSPLARGLREAMGCIMVRPRIIPARAGFTFSGLTTRTQRQDHPRSRGVYYSGSVPKRTMCGSSPLARGLRELRPHLGDERRIIPARAGFTKRQSRSRLRRQDHPRSRGVYVDDMQAWITSRGSSPLARGLHAPSHDRVRRLRIIPARAGFTWSAGRGQSAFRDHPRSRGVYRVSIGESSAICGSSPLARGLPCPITP